MTLALLAACSTAAEPTTSTRPTETTVSTTTTSSTTTVPATSSSSSTAATLAVVDTGDIAGFDVTEVTLADEVLLLAVADTAQLRGRGLMFVEDFGDLDGMVFVFDGDVTNRFWMKDTLVPLDIAFFSAEGILVDVFEMVPCETATCPRYQPAGVYRYAVERPAGTMVGVLSPADLLGVDGLSSS